MRIDSPPLQLSIPIGESNLSTCPKIPDHYIELFFKWIKQHLRIKAFLGTTPNAVKTEIWIAISTYLLVAILKKRLRIEQPLYTILQILSVSLFEKTPISQAFQACDYEAEVPQDRNQLALFD